MPGSRVATAVLMECMCHGMDGAHAADFVGKEKQPTLVFDVTFDHRYRIMHFTEAHAGATNDKFVVIGDEFHTLIMHTQLYKDYTSLTCIHREMEPELVTKGATCCATVDTAIGDIWCLRSHTSNHFLHV